MKDYIQITTNSNIDLIEFIDKYSKGMCGRLLTMETNGFGIYTHFGKLFIRDGDYLVWDGYAFIPYHKEHFEYIQDEDLKEFPAFSKCR